MPRIEIPSVAEWRDEGDTSSEPITTLLYNAKTARFTFNPPPLPKVEGVPSPVDHLAPVHWVVLPKVSVVILSHREEMLYEAFRSVKAQTVQNVQIVVQHCDLAWPTKLNEIVAATVGEWLVVLCDDDQLDPHFLERCLAFSEMADIVYTDRRVFPDGALPQTGVHFRMHGPALSRPSGDHAHAFTTRMTPEQFAFGQALPMTFLVRRAWWDMLGGHDPAVPHSDTEFWYRSVLAGARTLYVPEPLFWYREHEAQYSRTHSALWNAIAAFHKKHFLQFGFAWEDAYPVSDDEWHIDVIPPEDRESYLERRLVACG